MSDNTDVFNQFLKKIAKEIQHDNLDDLGEHLGFTPAEIKLFKDENKRTVTTEGTLQMLKKWRDGQTETNQRGNLKAAMKKAGLVCLVDKYFSADEMGQHPRRTTPASTVQGARELASTDTENSPVQLQSHVTETSKSPSIFISYQWDKQPEIMRLFSRLTGLRYHCWLDKQNMGGGDELSSEIVKGLTNAKVVISCVTPKYVLSKNCRREVSLSEALHKPIIPLLLEKMTWPPEGPMCMTFIQLLYIDFTKETTQARFEDEKFEELIKMINKYTQPMIEIMPATEEGNVDEHLQTATPKAEDELLGATARVQVHEKQIDTTQTTEDQGKEKEEEKVEEKEDEEEQDYMAMKSLLHETGKENVTQIKMECHETVGVKGGKLQLNSFRIELEIPKDAIDSKVPQEISLRVLTDTPNLGNSKEEMSVCFGVQCLAPDDLVLKLPVTYTIPHCAVITRYSSVEAVLYTGEGEYSPDAVVKERIILSRTGTPSCIITKDVLKLKMNHFSWAKIKLRIKNIFLRGKKMCCWPFKENNLALQRTSGMLHAHLYDAIKGNSELVESKEVKYNFIPAVMEQEVLIKPTKGHLQMTCYVEETVIKEHVVSLDVLMSGTRIYEPFRLDFTNHSDGVAVLLDVGQKNLEVHFDFQLEDRRERASPQDEEQVLQGASSSQKQRTSHGSTGETQDKMSGNIDVFNQFLKKIAEEIHDDNLDDLGEHLGFTPAQIGLFKDENKRTVTTKGTLKMLKKWRDGQTEANQRENLKAAMEKADLVRLVDKYFSADEMGQHPRHTTPASTVQGAREPTSTATENSPVQLQSHVTETSEPPSIFISYQWDKQTEVMRLYSRLTGRGYRCWLDKKNMGGGDELSSEIVKGLTNAKVVISCVTPMYALSKMCQKEVSLSKERGKHILPLMFEKMTWPPEGPMALGFTGVLYIDCSKESTQARFEDEKFDELIEKINQHV